ncbi:MAG: AAA family ATPase, partial [Anaerolineales bacterium]|nr:AAA family ATPase [Anaerolineales bacterium]
MLEIRLLGQFTVTLAGRPVEIGSRPARLLLAYLALNAGVDHPREDLAARLWPDADPTTARNNLRNVLYKLREALKAGPACLRADSESVALDLAAGGWLDVAALRVRRDPARLTTAELIQQAALYQGRLLPGYTENWVDVERMRAREAFERWQAVLLDRLAGEGRWAELREWSSHWITQVEHTPEAAYRGLMLAHAGLGDFSQAEAAYKACASALKKELNDPEWEPAEATRSLYERLRQDHKAAAARPSTPAPGRAPALAPAPEPLPPAPAFVGRERELAEIAARLAEPACRLLTLVGPGGVGKTRLARQAAAAHRDLYPDGAAFVPLAAAGGPEAILAAVAGALNFTFYGRERPRQQVLDYLREKRVLLVLDNFEHLTAHVDLVDDLLTAAPGLRLIVTSRERLRVPGEWLLEVDGLPFPAEAEAPDAEAYGAVQLFLQTARRLYSRTTFTDELPAIARLCRLVDGLPLAIEMAAAWVRALPAAEIARQVEQNLALFARPLPHMPERQHSVRAVFEQSWSLLSEAEQRVLRRLSVFRGGFQKEAAERVAAAPLALLLSLTDKSLVRRRPDGRFEMHELLRQYAGEKL